MQVESSETQQILVQDRPPHRRYHPIGSPPRSDDHRHHGDEVDPDHVMLLMVLITSQVRGGGVEEIYEDEVGERYRVSGDAMKTR